MKIRTSVLGATAVCVAMAFTAGAALAGPAGNWKRPNGSIAKVWSCKGGLCAKVVKGKGSGTVMFNGIKKKGSAWKGDMKHPAMPGTFNGTVSGGGKTLNVKGCMIGGLLCDSEKWSRIK